MTIAALMLSGLSSYDRAEACVETWLKDFDWFQIHSFAPCHTLPITQVGRREGPRSCFDKRLMGLAQVVATEPVNFDWYLCCSDDNYVWRRNLESNLANWRTHQCYDEREPMLVGGHTNYIRIANGTLVKYPSGGAGYVLNRVAIELLVGAMRDDDLVGFWNLASNNDDIEDAFMGWACQKLCIPYFEPPGFFGCNPTIGCDRGCQPIENAISYHYVTAEQMREFHSKREEKHEC